ncbi:hypothetical protein B4Q13_20160, partial [Lacticaseibacillus rhamnosus]
MWRRRLGASSFAEFYSVGVAKMAQWWQQADFDSFHELTQAMIVVFHGLESAARQVHCKLVVSENS